MRARFVSCLIVIGLLFGCAEAREGARPVQPPSSQPRSGADAAGTQGDRAAAEGGAGAAGAFTPEPEEDECSQTDVRIERVVPTVWLLIAGSGSMAGPLASSESPRWNALRRSLLDATSGIVPKLARDVKFGMVLYDGPLGGVPPTDQCPRFTTVEPKLDNVDELERAFPLLPPGGSTPTHEAISYLLSRQPSSAPNAVDPTYVVLATDSAPNDFCTSDPRNSSSVQREVVELTERMARQGAPVYVISLASRDAMLAAHLAQVAAAGRTNSSAFMPETEAQLAETFRQILDSELSCLIRLPYPYSLRNACMGKAILNDTVLECDRADGWKLRDNTTLELTGKVCETFKQGAAHLEAYFPCPLTIEN